MHACNPKNPIKPTFPKALQPYKPQTLSKSLGGFGVRVQGFGASKPQLAALSLRAVLLYKACVFRAVWLEASGGEDFRVSSGCPAGCFFAIYIST